MHRNVLFIALLIVVSSDANTEELFPSLREEPIGWGIGAGALIEDEGYVGVGSETEPVPVLLIQQGRFRLFGLQADFRLVGNERSFIGLRADYRLDGYEDGDGEIFTGMAERKPALSAGVSGKYSSRFGQVFFDLVRATSSERGMRGGIYYGYPLEVGSLTVLPKLGVEYFDADFVRYYYGVRPEEALATRPAYAGDATINLDVGVDFHYVLTQHHSLIASLKYRSFGSEIKDSPLIQDSGSPRVNVGYLYRF